MTKFGQKMAKNGVIFDVFFTRIQKSRKKSPFFEQKKFGGPMSELFSEFWTKK
jgi:predicted O-linked N-acetylglucosamine transferase (SPINDLY family)